MGKENNNNNGNNTDDGGEDGGKNNLMGLFAPPQRRSHQACQQQSSLSLSGDETDALLQSVVSVSADHNYNNNNDDDDDIRLTIREGEVENLTTTTPPQCYGSSSTASRPNDPYNNNNNNNKNISSLFSSSSASAFPSSRTNTRTTTTTTTTSSSAFVKTISSYLIPYTSVSTWLGGIMFVLYHVVFCMANGGSITRPYSDISMIGDMARYTAVGIMVSCPFLIYRLSDRHHNNVIIGIPAMFPSTDLFLAPFMAEAASVIDKCITDDINSGILDLNSLLNNNDNADADNDEALIITRLWFGSFAVVISFGMALSGVLLIVASKNKLANLG
jgi:hypothetical protein